MSETHSLGGRYELGDVIGRGGMAEVRRGVDTRLGRTVAIKMLRVDYASDPTFQARFRREAQSAASLNHHNIAAVYDTGEDILNGNNVPFIVMEYVDGKTLREMLQEGQRLTPERAAEITSGILDALEYSHRAGIVHRDIKPGNVMLTRTNEIKVMDFGIARSLAETGASLTQTAAVVGTAQYISPEQARGEAADARSDLYATGCVLYELLTGRPPFVGESLVSVAVSHVREIPTPPSALQPGISRDLDAVVMKALAKDRMERYQSAYDMRADLDRAATGLPVAAVADTAASTQLISTAANTYDDATPLPPEEEDEEGGPRWWAVVLTALVVLGVAGVIGWLIFRPDSAEPVAVPNVVGSTQAEAEAEIEDAGLVVGEITTTEDTDEEPLTVLSQEPSGGTLEPGSPVDLEVAADPDQVIVPPDLVGMSLEQAEAAIEDADLTVGNVEEQPTADSDPQTVLDADPSSGTPVAPGSPVNLVIAIEPDTVTVPDVVGQSREQAQANLEGAGFTVGEVTEQNSTEPAGQVLSTDPEADAEVEPDTTVNLTVSNGESEIPDVVGNSAAEAEAILRQAGFDVQVEEQENGDVAEGTVFEQTPEANSSLEEGGLVVITVATAPDNDETEVPDVVGESQEQATAALETAGYVVQVDEEEDDTADAGTVLRQSPEPGSPLNEGQNVTIVIAAEPEGPRNAGWNG